MLGSVFPVLFASEDFCNKYLRDQPTTGGLVTIKSNKCLRILYLSDLIENRLKKLILFNFLSIAKGLQVK